MALRNTDLEFISADMWYCNIRLIQLRAQIEELNRLLEKGVPYDVKVQAENLLKMYYEEYVRLSYVTEYSDNNEQ